MRTIQLLIVSCVFLVGMTLPSSLSDQSLIFMHPINVSSGQDVSRNWSGYVVERGTYTSVTGTWTIPQPSYRDYGADATWVGIGGASNQDLIQAGTQGIVNRNGRVTYQAFFELLPDISQPLAITVYGGDQVTVSIEQRADMLWLISFDNKTTGQHTQMTHYYSSSLSSAEWIEEAPSGTNHFLPLDNFGSLQFSDCITTSNGQDLTIQEANAKSVTMIDGSGKILATPSMLGNDGKSFRITRSSTSPVTQSTHFYHALFKHEKGGQTPILHDFLSIDTNRSN